MQSVLQSPLQVSGQQSRSNLCPLPLDFSYLLDGPWYLTLVLPLKTFCSSPSIPFTCSFCFCHHWITHFFINVLSLTGLPATCGMDPNLINCCGAQSVWHSSIYIVGSLWMWVYESCQPPVYQVFLSTLNIYCQVLWETARIALKERCYPLIVKLGQIKCKWIRWVFCRSNSLCNPLRVTEEFLGTSKI